MTTFDVINENVPTLEDETTFDNATSDYGDFDRLVEVAHDQYLQLADNPFDFDNFDENISCNIPKDQRKLRYSRLEHLISLVLNINVVSINLHSCSCFYRGIRGYSDQ